MNAGHRAAPDSALLAEIAGRQLLRGISADDPFILIDLDDELHMSVIDPDGGRLLDQVDLATVRPATLDQLLAGHLIRTGRVDAPTSEAWTAELVELSGRGRARLATTDGTFIMGRNQVKFFRVAQRDLDEATADLGAEVAATVRRLADAAPDVTSVVFGAGYDIWPGLPQLLERSLDLPVLASGFSGAPATPNIRRHQDATDHQVRPVRPAAVQPATVDPSPAAVAAPMSYRPASRHPEPYFDESYFDESNPPASYPPASYPPASHGPAGESSETSVPQAVAPEQVSPPAVAPAQPPPVSPGHVERSQVAFGGADDWGSQRSADQHGRRQGDRARWLVGGLVCAAAVIGIGTAGALLITDNGSHSTGPVRVADAATRSSTPQSTYADPADFAEARLPAVQYTPLPPPAATSDTTRQLSVPQPNHPRPHPRPRPRQHVIPNPIPGLPPIVLPG